MSASQARVEYRRGSTGGLKADLGALLWARATIALIGFFTKIATRRLLGPSLTGVWNYVEVLSTQLAAVSLGVASSAERKMPILRGQGETTKEKELRSLTFTYMLGEGCILGLLFGVYWYWHGADYDRSLRLGLLSVPILLVIGRVVGFYRLAIPNVKAFRTFAWTSVISSLLDFILVLFIFLGGLSGIFVGLIAVGLAQIGMYWYLVRRHGLFTIRWRFDLRETWRLLPIGLPMAALGLASSLMERVDAIMISTFLGTTALGLYYLGPQLAVSISNFPKVLAHIAYPNFLEEYGKNGPRGLVPDAKRYMDLSMYLLVPMMVSAAFFFTEFAIRALLPLFIPGLAAIQVTILGVIFWQIDFLGTQILLVSGRVWLLIAVTFTSTLVIASLIAIAFWVHLPLVAIGWAVVFGRFCDSVLLTVTAYRTMDGKAVRHVWTWAPIFLMGWVWVGLMLGLQRFLIIPGVESSLFSLSIAVVIREVVFGLAVLLFLLVFQRSLLAESWDQLLSMLKFAIPTSAYTALRKTVRVNN